MFALTRTVFSPTRSKNYSARSIAPWIATLAASSLLVACGSSSAPASTGSAGGSSQPTTSVTIGKAVDTIGFTTLDVATAKGYFTDAHIQAKEELLGGSSTAFAALQSGGVNFVMASSTALMNARAKGVPLQAVASLDYGVSLQMIVSNDWIKSHNLSADQPLDTVMKGLQGATLGIISTTDLTYNQYLMKAAGVNPDQFKTISLKTQSAALAALGHGQINAFLLSPPNSYLAQSQNNATIIATLHSVPQLSKMTYDILITTEDYAKSNPSVVKSVATALARADNVMASDPQSVLPTLKSHYPSMSEKVLLDSLKYVTFTKDGQMSETSWQDAKDVAVQTGLKVSAVDISPSGGTWTNKYIDRSALTSG